LAGLPLELWQNGELHSSTLVMNNFEYFQLEAKRPGTALVKISDKGKGSRLFSLNDGVTVGGEKQNKVMVDSFEGEQIEGIRAVRIPGTEGTPLLSATAGASGRNSHSSILNLDGKKKQETIHVFSLATGFVYERLMKVMIYSAVTATSSPIHFHLLENFLSPTFKTDLAKMSQELDFEFSFVSYKVTSCLLK